jgi:hypothetical protein
MGLPSAKLRTDFEHFLIFQNGSGVSTWGSKVKRFQVFNSPNRSDPGNEGFKRSPNNNDRSHLNEEFIGVRMGAEPEGARKAY